MKRVVNSRLATMLLFATLLLAAAPMSADAAANSEPITFTAAESFNPMLGDYDFDLYNRTSGWVLNGFYTQENGKWSKNWLSTKLQPGKVFRMVWSATSNEGACVVPFKATWDDYDKPEVYSLDWCKGIKSIYLKDTTFTVDYK